MREPGREVRGQKGAAYNRTRPCGLSNRRNFQEVYGGGEDHQMDADGRLGLWEKIEGMAGSALEMFTPGDVEAAMKASNFN